MRRLSEQEKRRWEDINRQRIKRQWARIEAGKRFISFCLLLESADLFPDMVSFMTNDFSSVAVDETENRCDDGEDQFEPAAVRKGNGERRCCAESAD